jgi:mandelate racemase
VFWQSQLSCRSLDFSGGRKTHPRLITAGTAGPDAAAGEATKSIELGFRCVKFKVGYSHVEQDRAVIRATRGAAGEYLRVMADYNQSLSVPEAIRRVQLLVWVEDPTRTDDFAGRARIAAECRTPIQIGENFWGPHDLTKCLAAGGLGLGASDFMMLDVMKIGGITGWLRTASQTEAAGLPVNSARS